MQRAHVHGLEQYPEVVQAANSVGSATQPWLTELCIQVQQVAAPTDAEQARAEWVRDYFAQLQLADIAIDDRANVYARLPGQTATPALMVSAHTDTVFPIETDLTAKIDQKTGFVYGPGIGDNSTGVAALLALAKLAKDLPPPPTDIWFIANSGEEGLGDLRGMRAAVDRLKEQIGACIVIEGMGLRRVVHRALGSRRFRITVQAPGGHSWSDYGTASAIHVLTRLAAELSMLQPPNKPRTTFNIGRFTGGTSINTIAQEASLELDLRSEEQSTLQAIIEEVLSIVERYQSTTWQKQGVSVHATTIGDRPGGEIADDHPLVTASFDLLAACGVKANSLLRISSTDANIPLSQGIPAVCIGITEGGNAHRLEEWMDPRLLPTGMRYLLMLTWWSSHWLTT